MARWKCLGGFCVEGDEGCDFIECPYADLSECTADGCAAPSYNCVNGDCVLAGVLGVGFYSSLAACEAACFLPPPPPTGTGTDDPGASWDCVAQTGTQLGGICVDPGDGSGFYDTLQECEDFCLRFIAEPAACADVENETTQTRRRTGCSDMLEEYRDDSYVEIWKISAGCGTQCQDWLEQWSDSTIYQVIRQEVHAPPCLCIPGLPEDCDPSSVVLHSVVSAPGCASIDGAEFDLFYDGTDCDHVWRGTFVASNGCVLSAEVRCVCCTLTGTFGFGSAATCGVGSEVETEYQCNPLMVTISRDTCSYTQIPLIDCGTCAISMTITLAA